MANHSTLVLVVVAVVVALLTAGVMTLVLDNEASESETEITVAGSTTIQPIMNSWKEQYERETVGVTITVTGGGSGAGISQVGQGMVDIGMSSRDLKAEELESFPDLVTHVIGKDGVAVIVGSGAGVSNLTMDQIRQIFAGEITNWNEVGGNNGEIVVYTRDESSGTRDCFESVVMGDSEITDSANQVASNGAMKSSVENNPYGIGYISFGYLDGLSGAQAVSVDGVEPTVDNVLSEEYPIQRSLILVTNGEPTGWTAAFLEWVLQPTAQQLLEDEGFIPL